MFHFDFQPIQDNIPFAFPYQKMAVELARCLSLITRRISESTIALTKATTSIVKQPDEAKLKESVAEVGSHSMKVCPHVSCTFLHREAVSSFTFFVCVNLGRQDAFVNQLMLGLVCWDYQRSGDQISLAKNCEIAFKRIYAHMSDPVPHICIHSMLLCSFSWPQIIIQSLAES